MPFLFLKFRNMYGWAFTYEGAVTTKKSHNAKEMY